jgi:hypothetical protein
MVKKRGAENRSWKMERFTKGSGIMTWRMGRADSFILTGTSMKEIGWTTKQKDMGHTFITMGLVMKANECKTTKKVRV